MFLLWIYYISAFLFQWTISVVIIRKIVILVLVKWVSGSTGDSERILSSLSEVHLYPSHWGSDSLSLHLLFFLISEISLGIAYDRNSTKDPLHPSNTNRTGECREHINTVSQMSVLQKCMSVKVLPFSYFTLSNVRTPRRVF